MNYEEFRKTLFTRLPDYLPESCRDMAVVQYRSMKTNQILDGLYLKERSAFSAKEEMRPMVYIEPLYNSYLKNGNLDEALKTAAYVLVETHDEAEKMASEVIADLKSVKDKKDKILFEFINANANQEMLKGRPHRRFHDLALVYFIMLTKSGGEILGVPITDSMANFLEMDENALYEAARENTRRLLPVRLEPMDDIIKRSAMDSGLSEEETEELLSDKEQMGPEWALYVLTNDINVNGAVAMLYTDVLNELAQKLGSDLYIVPSSVHEVFLVSTKGKTAETMVRAALMSEDEKTLHAGEWLSDSIYQYDRGQKAITVAWSAENCE